MKIATISDVARFNKVIESCKGDVWLESVAGDRYNLKSALTRYIAIADLLRDEAGNLELFASEREDEAKLIEFISSLE